MQLFTFVKQINTITYYIAGWTGPIKHHPCRKWKVLHTGLKLTCSIHAAENRKCSTLDSKWHATSMQLEIESISPPYWTQSDMQHPYT